MFKVSSNLLFFICMFIEGVSILYYILVCLLKQPKNVAVMNALKHESKTFV
jgi:hypothetical protein